MVPPSNRHFRSLVACLSVLSNALRLRRVPLWAAAQYDGLVTAYIAAAIKAKVTLVEKHQLGATA